MLDRLNRAIARFRALLGGYFWTPCPVCGEPFGGHEHGAGVVRPFGVPIGGKVGPDGKPMVGVRVGYRMVCRRPACNAIAGYLEAHELLTTDPEGLMVANAMARDYRQLIDVNTRGQS